MSTPTEQDYSAGNKLIAGIIFTEQENLAADVYYPGMPLAFNKVPVATGPVAGNGTCTVLSAGPEIEAGVWTLDFSAALIADLKNPAGTIVGTYAFTATADSETVVDYKGLRFTITIGSSAFTASSIFTITVPAAGVYAYSATQFDAFYNGATKTLGSAGYGSVIVGGELYEGGMVTDANVVITMTTALRAQMRANGFYPRKVA